MGRPERPVDPQAGSVQRFAWELRQLREKAGSPSYRQLSRRAHFSATALSEAAGGEQLPSLAVATAYVRACDGDVAEWEERWREVAAEVLPPGQSNGDIPPYVGLAAFQPEDADRFYGREALVADLVDRVGKQWFLGVFGPSGCGKSSLLRAGLVPAVPWRTVLMTPTAHPLRELANRLDGLDGEAGLVVVDQFEEIFTLCQDPGERDRFVAALTDCGARVVLGCRADFLGPCASLPGLVSALRDAQVLVGPMTGDELRRAIEEPAVRHGLKVDPDMVSAALTDVPGQAGALPLLSHALLETWRRRENGRLTLAGYRACGGVTGAIAATAEHTYSALAPQAQAVARGVLLRLVQSGTGNGDLRRRAALSEVVAAGDPAETTTVVNALAAARLVVVADGVVELAHEALTRAWPRLREWISEDQESLRIHRGLTSAALAWESLDRDPCTLYRGVRLAAARTLAERDDWPVLSTPVEREFLDASAEQEAAERKAAWRRARRTRRLAQALGVLLVASLLITAVAVAQRRTAVHEQHVAQSRQRALQAQDLSVAWPDTAAELAVSAYRTAPTAEARGALLSTAAYKPSRVVFEDHQGTVRAVTHSPDGKLIASAGDDHTVLLRDPASESPPLPLTGHDEPIRALAFQPDGRLLASAGDGERIILWDVRAHTPTRVLLVPHGRLTSLAFSADGRTLASASQDGTVILWDTVTWSELTRVPHNLGKVNGIVFSGNGTLIALAAQSGVLVHDRTHGNQTFHDHDNAVLSVALSPDGRTLATGGEDSQVVLRDLSGRTPPRHLRRHISSVRALEFTPDGSMLLSAGDDGTIRWWSVPNGGWLTGLITRAAAFHTADLSPDGRRLATGGEENVSVWPTALPPFTGHAIPPTGATFSPDGHHFATAGPDQLVIVWRDDGTKQTTLTTPAPVTALAFHSDDTLITTDADGAVTAWDPTGHRPPRGVTRHANPVTGVALTRELGASSDTAGIIRLWDPAGHASARELPATHTTAVRAIAFSPDGTILASGGDDGRIVLWDVRQNRRLAILSHRGSAVKGIAFTPDGHRLASGDVTGRITMWDLDTHTPRRTMPGQRGSIRSLAVNAEGTLLATAGSDSVITLWDPNTGAHVATLTGHTGPANAVTFGPAGKNVLASTGADPRVILWHLDPDTVINHICQQPHTRCEPP